jgi:hypothetical protein
MQDHFHRQGLLSDQAKTVVPQKVYSKIAAGVPTVEEQAKTNYRGSSLCSE